METDRKNGDGRCASLRVRVSLSEKDLLERNAMEAGLTLSDWIRLKSIGTEPMFRKPGPDREILLKFLAAYGKAGSNLNQIARHCNRKQGSPDFVIPLELIMYSLNEFRTLSEQLRKILDHGS